MLTKKNFGPTWFSWSNQSRVERLTQSTVKLCSALQTALTEFYWTLFCCLSPGTFCAHNTTVCFCVREEKHSSQTLSDWENPKICEMKWIGTKTWTLSHRSSLFWIIKSVTELFQRNVVVNGDILLLLSNKSPDDCPAVQFEKIRVKISSCGFTYLDCY